jgi:hypothetical protein
VSVVLAAQRAAYVEKQKSRSPRLLVVQRGSERPAGVCFRKRWFRAFGPSACRTWFLWAFTAKLAGQRMASRPGQRPLLERLGLGCAPRLGEQLGQVDDLRFEPGPPDALLELAVTAGVDRHHDVHVRLVELSKLVGEDAPRVVRS